MKVILQTPDKICFSEILKNLATGTFTWLMAHIITTFQQKMGRSMWYAYVKLEFFNYTGPPRTYHERMRNTNRLTAGGEKLRIASEKLET